MIHEVENIELCELLDMEPKAQCKVCLSYWDVGIVYCTCGHFLRNGTEENKKFVQYTHGSPLDSQLLHKERATPRAPLREEARGSRVLHREFAQEEMQEEELLGYHTTGSYLDEKFRKNMFDVGRNEEICREMDKMANEDHNAPPSLQKKFECTETIGGSVQTQLVPIRCQLGIELISNKHCQPCDSSKTKRIQLISKDGKVLPHLGGTGKNPGGILLLSIITTMDPALIDQGNLLKSDWADYSRYDSQNYFGAELQFKIR